MQRFIEFLVIIDLFLWVRVRPDITFRAIEYCLVLPVLSELL
jgi:hypothetical protein